MVIEAERLNVRRLGRHVLRDVSLRIDDGECVSIIGPNGAGKSTLMSALLGLVPADSGVVRVDGSEMHRLPRRQLARLIAYVPQVHDGYLGFRVRDVVESGRYAHLDPLEPLKDQDRAAVAAAVDACRIGELLEREVETLSGGERQKTWIAAALAQQSPALFLDEPTNALDPAHQVELIRIMRDHHRAGGTLLVICHDLNLPLVLGGRVIALRRGAVFFDQPVKALQDTGLLEQLYGAQFVLHRGANGHSVSIHLEMEPH
ncbi:MAG: ABC transporter ATP-binding protein [Phycisphaerae bacterium]|nr:ABC transporter ATP-binding protein [Phycisphaerae bacterium]